MMLTGDAAQLLCELNGVELRRGPYNLVLVQHDTPYYGGATTSRGWITSIATNARHIPYDELYRSLVQVLEHGGWPVHGEDPHDWPLVAD